MLSRIVVQLAKFFSLQSLQSLIEVNIQLKRDMDSDPDDLDGKDLPADEDVTDNGLLAELFGQLTFEPTTPDEEIPPDRLEQIYRRVGVWSAPVVIYVCENYMGRPATFTITLIAQQMNQRPHLQPNEIVDYKKVYLTIKALRDDGLVHVVGREAGQGRPMIFQYPYPTPQF